MKVKIVVSLLVLLAVLAACAPPPGPGAQEEVRQEVVRNQENRNIYVPRNDVEFKNYNRRIQLGDDPTVILWCTFFPPMGGAQQVFTVPVVGKLTSSGKRPFPKDIEHETDWNLGEQYSLGGGYYSREAEQPDGMYGDSSEYRYGFSPDDVYSDFTDLPSFCTTAPTVWQMNETRIVTAIDAHVMTETSQAQELLRAGDVDGAMKILRSVGE